VPLAPGKKIAGGMGVVSPRVRVADGGGKELDEAFGGLLSGVGDDGGQEEGAASDCHRATMLPPAGTISDRSVIGCLG
jgi:hypothetical protein